MNRVDAKKHIEVLRADSLDLLQHAKKPRFSRLLSTHSDKYKSNDHFIYELLQNAEDAYANYVEFKLEPTCLIITHDGKQLNRDNVEGITGVGCSSKDNNTKATGKFGTGFKSVFIYSDTVEIYSGAYSFSISDYICPNWIKNPKIVPDGISTVFCLPFNNPKKPADISFIEIKKGLHKISSSVLLFLENIKQIKWAICNDGSEILTKETSNYNLLNLLEFHRQSKNTKSQWLRIDECSCLDPQYNVSIAFKCRRSLEENKDNKIRYLVEPTKGKLHTLFDIEKETTNLRFHVNAPFYLTEDRSSINLEHDDNIMLRNQLVKLFKKSLLILRDSQLIDVHALNVLPNKEDMLEPYFSPFYNELIPLFNESQITPTRAGTYAPANYLYFCDDLEPLQNIFSDDDLKLLTGNEDAAWIADTNIDSQARIFIFDLNINYFNKNTLAKIICSLQDERLLEWIKTKEPLWLADFYPTLTCIESFELIKLNVILCDDGNIRSACEVYLPPVEEDIDVPNLHIISRELFLEDGQACERLRGIFKKYYQISTISEEVLLNIINSKYRRFAHNNIVLSKSEREQHILDIDRFIKYFKNNDGKAIGEYLLDESGIIHHGRYLFIDEPFKKTGLSILYNGKHLLRYPIWRGYKKYNALFLEYAKAIGVRVSLMPKSVSALDVPGISNYRQRDIENRKNENWDLPEEYGYLKFHIYEEHSNSPYESFEKNHNYDNEALRYNHYYLKDPEKNFPAPYALLLWNMMRSLKHAKNNSYGHYNWEYHKYFHAYYQAYRTKDNPKGPSSLLIHLRSWNWIPAKDGKYYIAADMTPTMLCAEFKYDREDLEPDGWLAKIGFGENVREREEAKKRNLVESSQKEHEFKEYLKKSHGIKIPLDKIAKLCKVISEEELDRFITEKSTKAENLVFISNSSNNPEHRQSMAGNDYEKHCNDRSYEVKKRSARTSKNEQQAHKYLQELYQPTPETSLRCQMCTRELLDPLVSFKRKDGSFYFESVGIFNKRFCRKENPSLHLMLCPRCAAEYCVIVLRDNVKLNEIWDQVINLASNDIDKDGDLKVRLGDSSYLYFVGKHWDDIRGILLKEVQMSKLDSK